MDFAGREGISPTVGLVTGGTGAGVVVRSLGESTLTAGSSAVGFLIRTLVLAGCLLNLSRSSFPWSIPSRGQNGGGGEVGGKKGWTGHTRGISLMVRIGSPLTDDFSTVSLRKGWILGLCRRRSSTGSDVGDIF